MSLASETKSAGNTPLTSPVLSRKVLQSSHYGGLPEKTNSTVPEALNDTVIIDPTALADETLEKTTVIQKTVNIITQCPCGMFDRKCIGIKCSACEKEWHTECCNLAGVTPSVAKKLETQTWKCPWCYEPSITKPCSQSGTQPNSEVYNKFTCSVSRLETFTEELSDNITSVEFFNQHIKHLLLDDTKFKLHSEKVDKLSADVEIIKEEVKNLSSIKSSEKTTVTNLSQGVSKILSQMDTLIQRPFPTSTQGSESTGLVNINQELSDLRQQVDTLVSRPHCNISQELGESLTKISAISIDDICKLGSSVDAFSDKIASMQANLSPSHEVTAIAQTSTASPGRMEPNTTSPHIHRSSDQLCDPFTLYKDEAMPQEIKQQLQTLIEGMESSFVTVGTDNSRDVLYFGEYSYRYSGGEHAAKPLPNEVKELIECIRLGLPNPEMPINSCLVSRYVDGSNSIPPHRDNEATIDPESDIITLSIGAERAMTFTSNGGVNIKHQVLKDCSMLVSSRRAQDFWLHSIEPCDTAEVRYSLTLRHIDPHFLKSTVILGDSNTVNVKFGDGVGKLGAWMPGKRIKVGHIEAIPNAEDIGPYRNILIHTGINSINCSARYKKSNKALIGILESKLRNICETYPKSKVFISLLLPTRLASLNYRVRDFNNLIMDMTCRLSRVCIIEHSLLGDVLSNEHGRWKPSEHGSNEFVPKLEDCLHLGKLGIRLLAKNFKQAVVGKPRTQSEARFSGGRGGYGSALVRRRQSHVND